MSLELVDLREMVRRRPSRSKHSIHFDYPYGPFPKNIMDEFERVTNKWLDNWSCHFDSKYVKEWIRINNTPMIMGASPQSQLGVNFEGLHPSQVNGPDLFTRTDNASTTGWGTSQLWSHDLITGTQTVGEFYDQVAAKITTVFGNQRLAVYDSGPTDLYVETSSIAVQSGYQFDSVTEFAIDDTDTWVAHQANNASLSRRFINPGNSTETYDFVFTYGNFQNPITTADVGNNSVGQFTVGHT